MAKDKKKPEIDYSKQTASEKEKALANTLTIIEKNYGKGSIMKLGQRAVQSVDVIPTGCLSLDVALGIGGVPRGRIVEVYGPEASGKTTVALHIVAQAQKMGGVASYIDAEHALDPVYAKKLGVNIDEMYISQPDDGEQALEIAEAMVRSGAIDIVVVDSVAALVPRAEIEGEMGASHMGLQARLMSQALRKLTGVVHKTNCTVVFINQLRDKIGGSSYGGGHYDNSTTTGGRALKFYASVRIEIKRAETIKVSDNPVGSRTKVKIAKNKLAPPFKTCEFDIMYGKGISADGDILDIAVDMNIVNKSGSWFSYKETRIAQGRENAKVYLKEHPETADEIEAAIRKELGVNEEESAKKQAKDGEEAKDTKKTKSKAKSSKSKKDAEEEVVLEEFDEDSEEDSEDFEDGSDEVLEFDGEISNDFDEDLDAPLLDIEFEEIDDDFDNE